jgi:hypothetical protein
MASSLKSKPKGGRRLDQTKEPFSLCSPNEMAEDTIGCPQDSNRLTHRTELQPRDDPDGHLSLLPSPVRVDASPGLNL